MASYRDKIESQNRNLSALQIRSNKCSRCKSRNNEKRKERREIVEVSQAIWRKLSPQQQLEKLDERMGINIGCVKQRKRICEKAEIDYIPAKPITFSELSS